jgi:uncharacterized membrane protein
MFLKLLHVLFAFLLVGSIAVQTTTYYYAIVSKDARTISTLLRISYQCESFFVIPFSFFVFIIGLANALLYGWFDGGFFVVNWLSVSIALFLLLIPFSCYSAFVNMFRNMRILREVDEGKAHPNTLRKLVRNTFAIAYRALEMYVVIIIIILMVLKPF